MYQEFYGLTENPFSLTPDPKYLFFTPRHQEALAQLFYGITERKGFMVLIGEVGTGKTLLLNKLLDALNDQNILSAYIFNPAMTTRDLFEYVAADFGLECNVGSKSQFLLQLNNLLIERYRRNQITVLIVDEAQNLNFDVLEELRMLTNLETTRDKLLQIVLAGQPELATKLDHPSLRQIKQRIALRHRLKPLTYEQTHDYIRARLAIAGRQGELPFSESAINKVYELSGGIPRLINNLCDNALLTGFVYNQPIIESSVICEVAEDLQLGQLSQATAPALAPITPTIPLASIQALPYRFARIGYLLRLCEKLWRSTRSIVLAQIARVRNRMGFAKGEL
ncbi:MAG: AAA family ATPase [Acidobacteriota bacterium]